MPTIKKTTWATLGLFSIGAIALIGAALFFPPVAAAIGIAVSITAAQWISAAFLCVGALSSMVGFLVAFPGTAQSRTGEKDPLLNSKNLGDLKVETSSVRDQDLVLDSQNTVEAALMAEKMASQGGTLAIPGVQITPETLQNAGKNLKKTPEPISADASQTNPFPKFTRQLFKNSDSLPIVSSYKEGEEASQKASLLPVSMGR